MMRSQTSQGKAAEALAQSIDELPEDDDDDDDEDDEDDCKGDDNDELDDDKEEEEEQDTGQYDGERKELSRQRRRQLSKQRKESADDTTTSGGRQAAISSSGESSTRVVPNRVLLVNPVAGKDGAPSSGESSETTRAEGGAGEVTSKSRDSKGDEENELNNEDSDEKSRTQRTAASCCGLSDLNSREQTQSRNRNRNNREYRASLQFVYEPKHYLANCTPIQFIPLTLGASSSSGGNSSSSSSSSSNQSQPNPQPAQPAQQSLSSLSIVKNCPGQQHNVQSAKLASLASSPLSSPTGKKRIIAKPIACTTTTTTAAASRELSRLQPAIRHQSSLPVLETGNSAPEATSGGDTNPSAPPLPVPELEASKSMDDEASAIANDNSQKPIGSNSSNSSSSNGSSRSNSVVSIISQQQQQQRQLIPKSLIETPSFVSNSLDNQHHQHHHQHQHVSFINGGQWRPVPVLTPGSHCNCSGKPMRSRSERLHMRRYSTSVAGQHQHQPAAPPLPQQQQQQQQQQQHHRQLISIIGANHPALLADSTLANYYAAATAATAATIAASSSSSATVPSQKSIRRLSVLPSGVHFTQSGSVLPLANPGGSSCSSCETCQTCKTAAAAAAGAENNRPIDKHQLSYQASQQQHQQQVANCRRTTAPIRARRYSSVYIAGDQIRRHTLASTTSW